MDPEKKQSWGSTSSLSSLLSLFLPLLNFTLPCYPHFIFMEYCPFSSETSIALVRLNISQNPKLAKHQIAYPVHLLLKIYPPSQFKNESSL
jgi:hypothetical protein